MRKQTNEKPEKPRILVILGPTASGKSDLAVKIARQFNGEIISADSRQVYKGLDIGSGKITKKEMRGVKHYLLDVVSPINTARTKKYFTVADFQKIAYKKIDTILESGKLPIIAGGTAFYIQSIVDGIVLPEISANQKLRDSLEKKSLPELQKILKKLDVARYKKIDSKNKVRLIRAIEISSVLGKVPMMKSVPKYESLQIGLSLPAEKLHSNIKKRLTSRLKIGMLDEARNLHKKGLSWNRMESLGLEYKYMALFLQNKISESEMVNQIETKSRQFAKRQMTWFKRDERINWFSPENINEISELITKFL